MARVCIRMECDPTAPCGGRISEWEIPKAIEALKASGGSLTCKHNCDTSMSVLSMDSIYALYKQAKGPISKLRGFFRKRPRKMEGEHPR